MLSFPRKINEINTIIFKTVSIALLLNSSSTTITHRHATHTMDIDFDDDSWSLDTTNPSKTQRGSLPSRHGIIIYAYNNYAYSSIKCIRLYTWVCLRKWNRYLQWTVHRTMHPYHVLPHQPPFNSFVARILHSQQLLLVHLHLHHPTLTISVPLLHTFCDNFNIFPIFCCFFNFRHYKFF